MVLNKILAFQQSFPITGPGIQTLGKIDATTKAERIVTNSIGILTIIAIIYFILQIIFAGYAFISSQGDPKAMETSRTRITEGILGLFIVIIAIGLGSLISTLLGVKNPLDFNIMFATMGL